MSIAPISPLHHDRRQRFAAAPVKSSVGEIVAVRFLSEIPCIDRGDYFNTRHRGTATATARTTEQI
jgi:hypothetical protein